MTTLTIYGLVLITVGAPLLVLSMGRSGAWLSAGLVVVFLAARAVANAVGASRTLRDYERGRCTRCGLRHAREPGPLPRMRGRAHLAGDSVLEKPVRLKEARRA